MDAGLWDVLVSPGRTEKMTLDQLDATFQSGGISAGTLIREPGSNDWRPLYEVAGLDPPEPVAPSAPMPTSAGPSPAQYISAPSEAQRAPAPSPASAGPSSPGSSNPAPEGQRARPQSLPPRRSGPPSKRTGRGVPLPSHPPQDDGSHTLNPKPLTPPRTSARRVSAPPGALPSGNGTRGRRAPPSILSAPAATVAAQDQAVSATKEAALGASPVAPSKAQGSTLGSETVAARATTPKTSAPVPGAASPPASPLRQSAPERPPREGSAIEPAPPPVIITGPRATNTTLGGSPASVPTAPTGTGPADDLTASSTALEPGVPATAAPAAVVPAPVVPTLRPQAPPLPENAFAHLGGASTVSAAALPASSAPPPTFASAAHAPLAASAPPAASYGFPGAPAVSPFPHNPWAPPPQSAVVQSWPLATETTQGLVLEERPLPKVNRLSKGELMLWVVASLMACVIVLQRNGNLAQWFGAAPGSSYARLESQLFGAPGLDTVAGVRALVAELDAKSPRPAGSAPPRSSR